MTKEEIKEYLDNDYTLLEVLHETEYTGCTDNYLLLHAIDVDPEFYMEDRAFEHILAMDIPDNILLDHFEGREMDDLDLEDFSRYCDIEQDNLMFYTYEVEDIKEFRNPENYETVVLE